MKLAYKIVLVNLGIAVVITIITLLAGGSSNGSGETALAFGLVCLGLSLLNLLVGLGLLISDKKELGKGLLLSFGILLLLSGISCGSGLSGMKF